MQFVSQISTRWNVFKTEEKQPLALNEVSIIPEIEGQLQTIEYENPLYKGATRFENPLYMDPSPTANDNFKSKLTFSN